MGEASVLEAWQGQRCHVPAHPQERKSTKFRKLGMETLMEFVMGTGSVDEEIVRDLRQDSFSRRLR